MQVALRIGLVHKFFDKPLLRKFCQFFDIVPKFLISQNGLDGFGKDANSSDCAQKLNIAVIIGLQDIVKLLHNVSKKLHMHILVRLQALANLPDYRA